MDKTSIFTPSLFQTPKTDLNLNKNRTCAQTLDPSELWLKRISESPVVNGDSNYTVKGDPLDLPMTKKEKQALYDLLDPISPRVNNGGGILDVLPSMLFSTFFAKDNYIVIQKLIKITVFKWSGQRIGDQSFQEIQNVMQSIFRDYATTVDECRTPRKELLSHIKNEVARLDNLVVTAVVPSIVNQVEQRLAFNTTIDQGQTKASFERPIADNVYGQMSYRPVSDIFSCKEKDCLQTRT